MKRSELAFCALLATSATAVAGFDISDGDTFSIDGEKIRIANIDAPELRSADCDAERRLGEVAARRLGELLESGKVAVIPGDPKDGRTRDRYDRLLATITVDGKAWARS